MEPLSEGSSKELGEISALSSDSMDGWNQRPQSYLRRENQIPPALDLNEVSPSSGSPGEKTVSGGLNPAPGGKSKLDNGLRSKRGGRALKIMVSIPREEEQRRKAKRLESMAEHAPLYPLDLDEHGIDSGQDEEESDRSSVFSPEVAANGFGSPIELPSRENLHDLLIRRQAEEKRMQRTLPTENFVRDQGYEVPESLDEIPLRSKLDPILDSHADNHYVEDIQLEESVSPVGKSLAAYIMQTLILILVWYIFSTLLTLYNKLLLGLNRGHFPAPLLMNTIHFSMQAVISTILIRFCKPSLLPTVQISWKDYFMRVVPTALATALDINLTNASLVFISVTFETMCKSGAPVFLLLFAFAFKLEVPSYKLLAVILIISSGVMLTVAKETEFNLLGFILVMAAALMAGFRWTVTQLLLQKEEYGLNNPYAVMSCLTPVMAALSLILSFILEPWSKFGQSHYFDTPEHVFSSLALMLLGGTLAFFMVSAEYILISKTSAVALTVAGVVKEVVTILVAVTFLHDKFTVQKGAGLMVIIIGVSLFNWLRYQKLVEGDSSLHGSGNRGGHHQYVALRESNPVFELGDELDEDIL